MKCPHCRFEWEPRRAARVEQSIMSLGPIVIAVVLCVSFFTGVGLWVAHGETAVEIIPGVTHYGGHSTSVEIIPGHRQYYGEIKGSATEITPGIQHYHLERSTPTQGENHVVPYPPAASRVLRDHPNGLARDPK